MATARKWRLVEGNDADLEAPGLALSGPPACFSRISEISEEFCADESALHRLLASKIIANHGRTQSTR